MRSSGGRPMVAALLGAACISSAAFLGERPSLPQLAGVALTLAGVLIAASGRRRRDAPPDQRISVP
jgi:drug/metabolite transporter (DMT)-like permease